MADHGVVAVNHSKIVTEFLLDTCRLQASEFNTLETVFFGMMSVSLQPCGEWFREMKAIPVTTGSSAEFYIQPMLSCVGDVDIMLQDTDELAIPEGHTPPVRLPDEFKSDVTVWEIKDSEYPGYVYLVSSYLLTKNSDTGEYNALQCDSCPYRSHRCSVHSRTGRIARSGPASTLHVPKDVRSVDLVNCVRCLSWPSQAADWPTRHRSYGWPDLATVDHIVRNGCDVVFAVHHLCKKDEWMSMHQARLSFSRAEIILLNSWMPVQQMVYHMLRFFVKTERLTDITDSTGRKMLSNYHIKTLMLWACELKPRSWWIDDLNVVRICVELLRTLGDWLRNRNCPHYFTNRCGLIDPTFDLEIPASRLMSTTEAWLSKWFVNNYIRKCAQLCPYEEVSRLFGDISTNVKLQEAVSAVAEWRPNIALDNLWLLSESAQFYVQSLEIPDIWFNRCALAFLDGCRHMAYFLGTFVTGIALLGLRTVYSLAHFVTAIAFLRVADKIANSCLSDNLLNTLEAFLRQFTGTRRHYFQCYSSLSSVHRAVTFMKAVANSACSTVQLIEIEVSKAYLHRALGCKDSDSDSIYCLANVYLAVLYYTTGQYQTAIDHCTLVRLHDHSQCSSHVLQGELLPPKSDQAVDVALGLAVFYRYVRTAVFNQQQHTQNTHLFTTILFVHYLHLRCLSVVKCRQFSHMPSITKVQPCIKFIRDTMQLFTADLLLLKWMIMSPEQKCQCTILPEQRQESTTTATELDTSKLIALLRQSAVEHLTRWREMEAHFFGSIATIVTTDFEALYAYKLGDYQLCLCLCMQNVHAILYDMLSTIGFAPRRLRMARLWMLSDFVPFLDDEIVSLNALMWIAHADLKSCGFISQLALSLYLMTQCQLKLHHSVASLAQTIDYIEVAQRLSPERTFDQLTLQLLARKLNRR